MIGGRPRGGEEKKGKDGGVDGELFFKISSRRNGRAVISVKAGADATPDNVRALIGTRVTEGADAAIFICVGKVTPDMATAASKDKILETPFGRFPRCQIVTVDQLFDRKPVDLPLIISGTSVAKEARKQPSKKKRPSPEHLRREPPLPPMAITGSRSRSKSAQKTLPLGEELLTPPRPKRPKHRSNDR